jgi:DNA sulfur modification protein DndD
MKIKRLVLENFGLFRGSNVIDLDTRVVRGRVKPIVLIGGKNGAGKTTILEAIRLCLYGPQGIADRISAKGYEQYLRGRVHRDDSLLINPASAAVTLVFEHAHIGSKHEFTVTRSWDLKESTVSVSLEVLRDGTPLDDIDRENAEDFLKDLVPPGVAQLYFFDGEKIQQLAEAEDVDAALSDAIKNLLGLELVERLKADLRIYQNRIDGDGQYASLDKLIDELESEIAEKKIELIELRLIVDEANSQVDTIRREIARQESMIAKEGGVYAEKRGELEIQKRSHAKRISEIENDIRGHAENLLPFSIVSQLCDDVATQLAAERELQEWITVEKKVKERASALQDKVQMLLRMKHQDIGIDLTQKIESVVSEALLQFDEMPSGLKNVRMIHNLSSDQSVFITNCISRSKSEIPREMEVLRESLEKETRLLLKVEQSIQKVPSEDQLKPLIDLLSDLNQRLGASLIVLEQKEAAYRASENKINEIERKISNAQIRNRELGKLHEKQDLAVRVQMVLEAYQTQLLRTKASELGQALSRRFSQLWRKGDRAKSVEIDAVTYEIFLRDRHGRVVPKKELSAGEKQIYAISILWALADVSGRPLPMVIDTPLGRLDGDHRNHLIERYFPHASHQVIILSTDTEIDEEYFHDLSPSVSHAIHLQYSQADARTIIEDEYFWKRRSNEKEVANAAE